MVPICGPTGPIIRDNLALALKTLPAHASVLILGRYPADVNILNGNGFTYYYDYLAKMTRVIYEERKDIQMMFRIIINSRTMQSDYVILLNNNRVFGFPEQYKEPLAISILLGDKSDGQYDNERRLLYVAMTRAKKTFFMVAQNGNKSEFYHEIFEDNKPRELMHCPVCGGVMDLHRRMKNGPLEYMCTNFQWTGCKYTRPYIGGRH